jgi:HD superfamily phosphohydrolase
VLNKMMNETKVIRDNVHGNIIIKYQIIWDLINTDVFQRLRRVHQLGGTFMVFSSAEHSRFTHSLGVYSIVDRIINEVMTDNLNEYDGIVGLCAGLLHDIGHGPYSHAFEDVFKTDHEEMTRRIILEDTSVNQVLRSYDENLPLAIAQVINKEYHNKLLVQLISSQVDADRMDYLLRDATNAGVSYGLFDLERLLRSMVVVDNRIAFKESGVHVLEDYIFARYHMYWQVYLHQTTRSYEIILHKLLSRVKVLFAASYQFKDDIRFLKPFLNKTTLAIKDYLNLDESILFYYFRCFMDEEDPILKELARCFINRVLFKQIDLDNIQQGLKIMNYIEDNFEKRANYFDISQVKSSLYNYYGEINSQSIIILTKNKELKELYNVSNLVNAIVKSAEEKQEVKLYFHQRYQSLINEGS